MKRVPWNRPVVFFAVALLGLTTDLATKAAVFSSLGYPGRSSQWVQTFFGGWVTFRFFTSFNRGALWGIGQGYTWLFAVLSLAALVGVLVWLFVFRAARSWWLTFSLALIAAGTLGNLYDRLGLPNCVDPITGQRIYAVRDFLLFTFGGWPWPVFNFADVFLVTGAGLLALHSFRWGEEPEAKAERDTGEGRADSTGRAGATVDQARSQVRPTADTDPATPQKSGKGGEAEPPSEAAVA